MYIASINYENINSCDVVSNSLAGEVTEVRKIILYFQIIAWYFICGLDSGTQTP
jgi:hypothetical protein